jgi:Pyruvate/2-oxoacid:ferredoxin oxidoreductase delta subunit
MKRDIIKIDENLCNGCGLCVMGCHEGALQIIEGKARLVNELFCDGLGACIGECPEGAIEIERREAEDYDEIKTMNNLLLTSEATVVAHLEHLRSHNAMEFYNQGIQYLNELNRIDILEKLGKPKMNQEHGHQPGACGCAGSAERTIKPAEQRPPVSRTRNQTELTHWPVQLHLVNPSAGFFKDSELVVMSTCGPIASANVHTDYLAGRAVVVACPKLDRTDPYAEKLAAIIQNANLRKIIVVIMEVPCCAGLSKIVKEGRMLSGIEDLIIEEHTLSLEGELINMRRI